MSKASKQQLDEMTCPLCGRGGQEMSDHHLVPKSRGGAETVLICSSCHGAIHELFSNKQLESDFKSVESLLGDEKFKSIARFISKQAGHVKTKRANDQRRRGRNG